VTGPPARQPPASNKLYNTGVVSTSPFDGFKYNHSGGKLVGGGDELFLSQIN
jgi:hypothetical protein